ncbi:isochorismate synthase [Halobacillus karajensis]|uniref:isochorismate synthase n=1 Tax=Halobacillus karajensis TaxID=195088 RepID=UPI0008A78658|nr:isochorismate synthase [Halobacillus karajensis]SEI13758.1 isochorismate synthase [Halobacillus karajensis]
MLHTKAPQLEEMIGEALQKAHHLGEPLFISIVEHIDDQDPYQFFEAGLDIDQHRSFWQSAENDLTMVGVGKASQLYAKSRQRFREVQSLWGELQEKAFVHDNYNQKGTGMVALGGFSFDPEKQEKTPWDNFSDSQMTIPAFLLTKVDGQSYLTINAMIFPEDHYQQIITQIKDHKHRLLHQGEWTHSLPFIDQLYEMVPEAWKRSVKQATEDIKAGLMEKVVLAREVRLTFKGDAHITSVLKALAQTQPNSYIFCYESEGSHFIGATPERLAKLDDRELVSTCLAGTIPRGLSEEEDQKLGEELLNDPKNRQEHQFVVEMIKEAVEACSRKVEVPDGPVLYPLRNLQHLYTPVKAVLDEGYTLLDVIAKLHPTPALGGLPQNVAVDYIRTHETLNRGWYAGPIGWFDAQDNGEFAVAIRSALIQKDEASLFAGCGVVEDSDPEAEYEETAVKLKPMMSVLGGSEWDM